MNDFIITGQMKMADIINKDKRALVFLPRFDIDLGFGDQTIRQICKGKNINPDFFLLMFNVFLNRNYFPNQRLKRVDVDLLLAYLNNAHRYYLEEKIPYLQALIAQFKMVVDHPATSQLERFFQEYMAEVKEHLAYEDHTAFPYVAKLLEQLKHEDINLVDLPYSIGEFEKRHDDIEEKLSDLKNLLIKYFPPCDDRYIRIRLINELMDFEEDLFNHARIEDKVLIPLVEQLEQKLSN